MITEYSVKNDVGREDLALGVMLAEEIVVDKAHAVLEERLARLLAGRQQGLSGEEEKVRSAARDLLRNGTYKPTGRAKPASEYLLRACLEKDFPRVNTGVDIINYISLKYLVPVSLWDVELAQSKRYRFRLGKKGESYVFNAAGQVIELEDLVTGFALQDQQELPIVTPVKDSLRSKTTPQTRTVMMVVYYPLATGSKGHLESVLQEGVELFAATTSKTPSLAIA